MYRGESAIVYSGNLFLKKMFLFTLYDVFQLRVGILGQTKELQRILSARESSLRIQAQIG